MNDFHAVSEGMNAKNLGNEGICKDLDEQLVGTTSSDNSELFQCFKSADVNNLKMDYNSLNEGAKCRNRSRKKKRFRPKKHKWKPFYKLTGDERRILDERISKRACRNREEMSASGLTLAPYNTTQFIIMDRNYEEPDFEFMYNEGRYLEELNALQSSSIRVTREEMNAMIQHHKTEQLQQSQNNDVAIDISNMSNKDMVEKIMQLEDKVEELETLLSDSLKEKKSAVNVDEEFLKITVYKDEIKKLKLGNRFLDYINERLENEVEYFCKKLDHSS